MKRAGVLVDVFPVWSDMDERCLNAQQAEEFRSFGSGGSIGAIDQNAKFAEIGRDAGCERFDIGVTKSGLAGERGARAADGGVAMASARASVCSWGRITSIRSLSTRPGMLILMCRETLPS